MRQFTVSVIQRAPDDITILILCRPHITETQTGTTLIPEVEQPIVYSSTTLISCCYKPAALRGCEAASHIKQLGRRSRLGIYAM